jgi:hypothetical protein
MVVSWWYCGEEEGQYVKPYCGEEEGQYVKPMQIKKSEDYETQQQKQYDGKSTAFQLFTSFLV